MIILFFIFLVCLDWSIIGLIFFDDRKYGPAGTFISLFFVSATLLQFSFYLTLAINKLITICKPFTIL